MKASFETNPILKAVASNSTLCVIFFPFVINLNASQWQLGIFMAGVHHLHKITTKAKLGSLRVFYQDKNTFWTLLGVTSISAWPDELWIEISDSYHFGFNFLFFFWLELCVMAKKALEKLAASHLMWFTCACKSYHPYVFHTALNIMSKVRVSNQVFKRLFVWKQGFKAE